MEYFLMTAEILADADGKAEGAWRARTPKYTASIMLPLKRMIRCSFLKKKQTVVWTKLLVDSRCRPSLETNQERYGTTVQLCHIRSINIYDIILLHMLNSLCNALDRQFGS